MQNETQNQDTQAAPQQPVMEEAQAAPPEQATDSAQAATSEVVHDEPGIPQQQEQQEQGFVEGDYDPGSEYDPGFIPEGEYTPGSGYEGAYGPERRDGPEGGDDPLFTWGGFEDDVVAEELVDASAADPWGGGTQPLETVGRADAAGDSAIEMYSEDARQTGVDAGVDENDIEMLP
jgi:hypothetical protein